MKQLYLALILIFAFPATLLAQCIKATNQEKLEKNIDWVELSARKMPYIQGQITIPRFTDAKTSIIEIYLFSEQNLEKVRKGTEISQVQKRILACKTNERGFFTIRDLRAGRYFMRVGLIGHNEFNPTHQVIVITPRAKKVFLAIPLALTH